MQALILYCHPHNQFRLGKTDLNQTQELIHSDTLFSAIISNHALIYGEKATDQLVDLFRNGKIRISSAFHCLENRKKAAGKEFFYFLPKPVAYELSTDGRKKTVKGIHFVSLAIWSQQISPHTLLSSPRLAHRYAISWEELQELELLNASEAKNFEAVTTQKPGRLLRDLNLRLAEVKLTRLATYPKVRVHQVGQEAAYFTQTNLQLQQISDHLQTHFYFLLDHDLEPDSVELNRFYTTVRMTADEGIGGDRSSGIGHFKEMKIRDFDIPHIDNPTHKCTLSLCVPKNDESLRQFDYYHLILRGGGPIGRTGSQETYRRQIRMIAEGAMHKGYVKGGLPSVSPDPAETRKLRNGINLSLPVNYA